jgi:NCAIR mutase (PurE)-related protein
MFLKLNEYIKNVKNTEYLINKMSNEILSHYPHIVTSEELDKNRTFRKNFFYVKPFQTKDVENILKKYQKIFDKEGLLFSYETKSGAYSPDGAFSYNYYVYVKEEKIERVKPPKYIYHTSSPQKRKSILENGLIPATGDWGGGRI